VIPAIATSAAAWLNPWHHYFPQAIVASGQLPWPGLLVLLAWCDLGTAAAVVLFERRDLA